MSEWISVKERLPKISYLESDNVEDPYECYPILVFCPEKPGIFCVAHLIKNQDENDWNYDELSWEFFINPALSLLLSGNLLFCSLWF